MSAEGRVENQKLNQMAALLSFGLVFGFQLDSLEKQLITLVVLGFTVSFSLEMIVVTQSRKIRKNVLFFFGVYFFSTGKARVSYLFISR